MRGAVLVPCETRAGSARFERTMSDDFKCDVAGDICRRRRRRWGRRAVTRKAGLVRREREV